MLEANVLCGGDSRYYFVRGYVAGSPSPRWLMSVGREEESLSVLKMVEHPDLVNASFEQMRNEMRKE